MLSNVNCIIQDHLLEPAQAYREIRSSEITPMQMNI